MNFSESKTKENLMRAFAGESQARNRYIFSAHKAKKDGLFVIESVFEFTAKQEEAHAKVFYDSLASEAAQNIKIDGNYPVDIYEDTLHLLRAAQHNEFQEYEHDYRKFSEIAEQEGFSNISKIFSNIANVEKTHGDRFGKFRESVVSAEFFLYVGFQRIVSELKFSCMSVKDRKRRL